MSGQKTNQGYTHPLKTIILTTFVSASMNDVPNPNKETFKMKETYMRYTDQEYKLTKYFIDRDVKCQCPFIDIILNQPDLDDEERDFEELREQFQEEMDQKARLRCIEEEGITPDREDYDDAMDEMEIYLSDYYVDPQQYWIVEETLGRQLSHKDEIVLIYGNTWVWCRLGSGMGIQYEHVMVEIYREGIERIMKDPNHPAHKGLT